MGMKIDNLCDSCTNIGCIFQSGIVRTECAFYMPPHIEPDNCGNYVVQDLTTKNDLGVDAVSRKAVHDMLENLPITVEDKWFNWLQKACMRLAELPSVTPQEPKCKDCKWWKDSDGKYRRGCGAESICRINTDKVYQGEGYCYLFESQESEG